MAYYVFGVVPPFLGPFLILGVTACPESLEMSRSWTAVSKCNGIDQKLAKWWGEICKGKGSV